MNSGYCNQKIFALLVVAHKKIFRVTFRARQHDIADFVHAENRLVPGDFVFNVFRGQKGRRFPVSSWFENYIRIFGNLHFQNRQP